MFEFCQRVGLDGFQKSILILFEELRDLQTHTKTCFLLQKSRATNFGMLRHASEQEFWVSLGSSDPNLQNDIKHVAIFQKSWNASVGMVRNCSEQDFVFLLEFLHGGSKQQQRASLPPQRRRSASVIIGNLQTSWADCEIVFRASLRLSQGSFAHRIVEICKSYLLQNCPVRESRARQARRTILVYIYIYI